MFSDRTRLTAALFLLLSAWFAPVQAEILQRIVAQVNNDIITLTDYNEARDALVTELRIRYKGNELAEKLAAAQKELLPTLIREALLVQKAREYGMAEDLELEVQSFVNDMMQRNNIPNLDALRQEMRKIGLDYGKFLENTRRQFLIHRLQGALLRQRVKILTSDIETYYAGHADEFTLPERIELEEIVLYTEGRETAEVRQQAAGLRQRLAAGEDFAQVARETSQGPTAGDGGRIGWFQPGELSPVIQAAVANLQPGNISDTLEMDFGFQIIRLANRQTPKLRPLSEVRGEIEERLFQLRAEPFIQEYVEQLKTEGYVYIHPEYQSDSPDS